MGSHMECVDALRTVLAAIAGRNNLIASDFADIDATEIVHEFMQDANGVRFDFVVSNHALGKLMSGAFRNALERLLNDC